MTSKQRAYLRGQANQIEPIFQIGKTGLSENLLVQLSDALNVIKLRKKPITNSCVIGFFCI